VDYSIHHYAPLQLLIANFKYTGDDYEADMKKIAQTPETQEWWRLTDGMQESLVEGAEGSGKEIPWWAVSLSKNWLVIGFFYHSLNRLSDSSRSIQI
jgi:L-rhamnose mutarotase